MCVLHNMYNYENNIPNNYCDYCVSQQNVDAIFTNRMNKAAVTMCFMILTPTTAVIMG